MKHVAAIFFVLAGAFALSACSATERGAAIGAGSGAVIGGLASGTVTGAAIGAGVGGVTGALLGRYADSDTRCVYEYPNGDRYIADCPAG